MDGLFFIRKFLLDLDYINLTNNTRRMKNFLMITVLIFSLSCLANVNSTFEDDVGVEQTTVSDAPMVATLHAVGTAVEVLAIKNAISTFETSTVQSALKQDYSTEMKTDKQTVIMPMLNASSGGLSYWQE